MVRQTCAFCKEDLGVVNPRRDEFRSWFHLAFRCSKTTDDEKKWLKREGI